MKMPIKKKMLTGIIIVLILTGLVGIYGIFNIKKMDSALNTLASEKIHIFESALFMELAISESKRVIEKYKSVVAGVDTKGANIFLNEFQKIFSINTHRFMEHGKRIIEGGYVDGQRIIPSDNADLQEIVKKVTELHNKRFQPLAKQIETLGHMVLKVNLRVDSARARMGDAYRNVDGAADKIEDDIKDIISPKLAFPIKELNNKELRHADLSMELRISISKGYNAVEEYLHQFDLKALPEIENNYKVSIGEYKEFMKALLKGGSTVEGRVEAVSNPAILRSLDKINKSQEKFNQASLDLFKEHRVRISIKNRINAAVEELDQVGEQIDVLTEKVIKSAQTEIKIAREAMSRRHTSANYTLILAIIIGLLFGFGVSVIFGKQLAIMNSENTKLHEEAKKSLEFFRSVVDDNADAIILQNSDHLVIHWNAGAEKLYGFSEEDVLNQPIDFIFTDDDTDRTLRGEPVFREGISCHFENTHLKMDGSEVFVDVTLSPIKNEDGKIIGITAIHKDLTERKRAEEELRKLNRAVDQAATLFIITNKDGNIEYINPRFSEVTGYSFKEVQGKNPRFLRGGGGFK